MMPLPIHIASSSGNKNFLKRLIDTVAPEVLEIKNECGKTPLMLAVIHHHFECVNLLLKAAVHVDNSDSLGQTALHIATNKGFHRCVKLLLSYDASYQLKDFSGITPLHLAAINPNSKCLSAVLKVLKPGESDIQDSSKKTALHWCSAWANASHVGMLLLKDANICIPDDQGKTPLHWAATNPTSSALDCVKILLEKEGNLINWQDYEGRSALHLAVGAGNIEVVRFLVSKETCNTDILDNAFCTPLHWAAKKGFADKADILLKKSLYTSADDSGATPLHYTAFHNYAKVVETFLSRSFIYDIADASGRNAILWAAARNADDVIEVMAKNGVLLDCSDKDGLTALHYASLKGHLSTIKILVKHGVPINKKDKCGMTPLLRACEFGRAKASQLLIQLGADATITDVNDCSMLHWCALGGHAYLCQMLLHKEMPANIQDAFGRTPLHYACMRSGHLNCVSVLLESNADPNIVDNKGKLPLHWAVLANHWEIVKLLCDYETDVNAMIKKNDWMTALDLAVTKNHYKIVEVLIMYGALHAEEIKNIAAQTIQQWFRNHHFIKQIYQNLHTKLIGSESKEISGKYSFLKSEDGNKDIKCLKGLHENNSEIQDVRNPGFASSIIENNSSKGMSIEKSTVIIQRAWRQYLMKMKFLKMQATIQRTFKTIDQRIEAEKQWCIKLQSFFEQW
ncbi:inversin isoform X1 [Parasteatoda tepidariorum]|uniref:inversin isoform X1 n=2 Tax=Parasteatoda tepidariorum TaxID=114398 RepID=UPI001C721C22|nr:inversin isoform X2 [Parasteatoda tepidariorum]